MKTTPSTAAEIARGLTEAQRRALLGDARWIGFPERLILIGSRSQMIKLTPTLAVLTRNGLIEKGRFGPTMVTEIGIAVREYLQGNPHDD